MDVPKDVGSRIELMAKLRFSAGASSRGRETTQISICQTSLDLFKIDAVENKGNDDQPGKINMLDVCMYGWRCFFLSSFSKHQMSLELVFLSFFFWFVSLFFCLASFFIHFLRW